jgi:hypothetical protein
MPRYKTHVLFTVLLVGVLFLLFSGVACLARLLVLSFIDKVIVLAGACAGALAPDIDTTSKGRTLWYAMLVCCIIAGLLLGNYILSGCCSAVLFLSLFAVHRGLFHAWWLFFGITIIFLIGICAYVPPLQQSMAILFVTSFLFGALGHLFLDYLF